MSWIFLDYLTDDIHSVQVYPQWDKIQIIDQQESLYIYAYHLCAAFLEPIWMNISLYTYCIYAPPKRAVIYSYVHTFAALPYIHSESMYVMLSVRIDTYMY